MKIERLWGSRLNESADETFIRFISGRDVRPMPPCDEVLIPYDLWGSRAHAAMLWKQKIIPTKDAQQLIRGLKEIEALYRQQAFVLDPSKEDVHTNVESFLIEKYGLEAGGKLHCARSRNDQVSVDMVLFLRDQNLAFFDHLHTLVNTLLALARNHAHTLVPGFTHHQHAMVTTLGHVALSYAESFVRDLTRLTHWHRLFNVNPLGAAAAYGSSFPIDRQLTSSLLGFDQPSANSLDRISNRWEAEAELAYLITVAMNHLSSLAQTLILFTTNEFGFVTLSDKCISGSSIMPQKRNPCGLEVTKAKASVAQGLLSSLLSISRALFVGYNRDSQWTKYLIMDLVHECSDAPLVMAFTLNTLNVNQARAEELCRRGFITATDLMEAIVQEYGLPLRQGKVLIERAVKYSEAEGAEAVTDKALNQALREMDLHISLPADYVSTRQDPRLALERRSAIGGPKPALVLQAIEELAHTLQELSQWAEHTRAYLASARGRLEAMEQTLLAEKA